jgi:MFS family permease
LSWYVAQERPSAVPAAKKAVLFSLYRRWLVSCAGMIGCGLSGTFNQLLLWRWVTGIGSSLQMAGSQLFLADISQTDNRAQYLGANQVGDCVGQKERAARALQEGGMPVVKRAT